MRECDDISDIEMNFRVILDILIGVALGLIQMTLDKNT